MTHFGNNLGLEKPYNMANIIGHLAFSIVPNTYTWRGRTNNNSYTAQCFLKPLTYWSETSPLQMFTSLIIGSSSISNLLFICIYSNKLSVNTNVQKQEH